MISTIMNPSPDLVDTIRRQTLAEKRHPFRDYPVYCYDWAKVRRNNIRFSKPQSVEEFFRTATLIEVYHSPFERFFDASVEHAVESFSHSPTGKSRPIDWYLAQVALQKLAEVSGKRPLRVLEVGAGTSYERVGYESTPTFSHRLKSIFGESVEVLVTDLGEARRNAQVWCMLMGLAPKPKYDPKSRHCSVRYMHVHLPKEDAAKLRIQALPGVAPGSYRARPYRLSEVATHLSPQGLAALYEKLCGREYFYLINGLDAALEKFAFGVNARIGVDYYHLQQHLPHKFDLVYGRNLLPGTRMPDIKASIRNVLAHDGVAVVDIDGDIVHRFDRAQEEDLSPYMDEWMVKCKRRYSDI